MYKQKYVMITVILLLALSLLSYGVFARSLSAIAPELGAAYSFAVLGGSAVTNTGLTVIRGDLGVWPSRSITGVLEGPGVVVPPGVIHRGDAVAQQAQSAVTTTSNALASQACDVNLTGQDLGGLTLTPGVYCFDSSAGLTGELTLNAQGNPNSVFIFQIASTLTTASDSSVIFTNGSSACNVFWNIGSSATLGTNTAFQGNILAYASITLTTGASIVPGRALARIAAVTMDRNTISMAECAIQATQTAVAAATHTAVAAATHTAVAATHTAVAATHTAVAAVTKTAVAAATQTATARIPTKTPTPTPTSAPKSLPETGFSPRHVTVLREQPVEKAFTEMKGLWLEIPSLNMLTPIVGVPQVDGEWDVSWLSNQVGWLHGSTFPTLSGNSVITGHVWDALNLPGPFVELNTLKYDDQVIVHAWGTEYVYEVRSVKRALPSNVNAMMKHEESPWLTLVTCQGYDEAKDTYKYRVLIRAVLIEVK